MNRKNVILWYISLGLLVSSVIPFLKMMSEITLENVCITAVWLGVTTVIYLFITRLITHEKGYTAIEAMSFYKLCRKNGIKKDKLLKSARRIEEIAAQRDYSKKLELNDLYEMYNIGCNILNRKGERL